MASAKGNTLGSRDDPCKDGIRYRTLKYWDEFQKILTNDIDPNEYFWRGQRQDVSLKSSFDRSVGTCYQQVRSDLLSRHLENFKREMERCHPGAVSSQDDEMWSLGQHYGLKTPLLDWTQCPYIAAYFAFEKPERNSQDTYRFIFALKPRLRRLITSSKERFVSEVRDQTNSNPRFKAQKGVFTKALNGDDIEMNVRRWCRKRRLNEEMLIKFAIPTSSRAECLGELGRMDINFKSLLLDIRDVAETCNEFQKCLVAVTEGTKAIGK